jgi:hypothetical protein
LEQKGKDRLAKAISEEAWSSQSVKSRIHYRIHNLWLTYKLKQGLDVPMLLSSHKISYKPMLDSAAAFSFETIEAKLFKTSIEIHLSDIDAELGANLDAKLFSAKEQADKLIEKIEARLGIGIYKIDKDTFTARLSSLHIALTHHDFAKEINDRDEKLEVRDDEGILRVIVDASHGFNEYEAVSSSYASPDAQKLGDFSKAIILGRFDYREEQKARQGIEALLLEYGKKLNVHLPILKGMIAEQAQNKLERAESIKTMRAFRRELRHARTSKAKEQDGQAELERWVR